MKGDKRIMKCTYKFMIYDVTKEKQFDYCQASFNKVLDWAEVEKLKDKEDKDTSNPNLYTKAKFELLRACAPDEVQMKEMLDDIVQYYEKYFAMEESVEDEKEIEICINCHKYAKYEYGSSAGSTVDIWYFSVLNALFAQANIYGQKYNLHQIVSNVWKDSTKDIFCNQWRYVMAHELFHVFCSKVKDHSIQRGVLEEIAAEYFALSYINDFCNAVGQNKSHLVLRGTFSEENKKSGDVLGLKKSIKEFVREEAESGVCVEDYFGGALLLALGIKNGTMGKDNPYFKKIYDAMHNNESKTALIELIELKKDFLN